MGTVLRALRTGVLASVTLTAFYLPVTSYVRYCQRTEIQASLCPSLPLVHAPRQQAATTVAERAPGPGRYGKYASAFVSAAAVEDDILCPFPGHTQYGV